MSDTVPTSVEMPAPVPVVPPAAPTPPIGVALVESPHVRDITYGFHTHVFTENLGGFRFRVTHALQYTSLCDDATYTVPVNFVTDFASSWIGQYSFLPKQFVVSESAVLHDYLYKTHLIPRQKADQLFKEALNTQNATAWIQFKAFRGVRMFGGGPWDSHTALGLENEQEP